MKRYYAQVISHLNTSLVLMVDTFSQQNAAPYPWVNAMTRSTRLFNAVNRLISKGQQFCSTKYQHFLSYTSYENSAQSKDTLSSPKDTTTTNNIRNYIFDGLAPGTT